MKFAAGMNSSYSSFGAEQGEMGEDVDPATGLINLADIMLVFATGLMMALVNHWNIDLGPQVKELVPENDMVEVTNLEDAKDLIAKGGSGYSSVGRVYKDPKTGQLYLLTEDASVAGGTGETSTSGSD